MLIRLEFSDVMSTVTGTGLLLSGGLVSPNITLSLLITLLYKLLLLLLLIEVLMLCNETLDNRCWRSPSDKNMSVTLRSSSLDCSLRIECRVKSIEKVGFFHVQVPVVAGRQQGTVCHR